MRLGKVERRVLDYIQNNKNATIRQILEDCSEMIGGRKNYSTVRCTLGRLTLKGLLKVENGRYESKNFGRY